jgi:hypothetical protein
VTGRGPVVSSGADRMGGTAMKARGVLASAGLGAWLFACNWVPLTDAGEGVRMAKPAELRGCTSVGRTHAQTTDRVLLFARSDQKIQEELQSLARNEAALMGGDAIAPAGPIERGRQTFDVYRCAKK